MQGAVSYELRTAIDLAALMADQGHRKEARLLLRQVYGRFTEGFKTADLRSAADLMSTLRMIPESVHERSFHNHSQLN